MVFIRNFFRQRKKTKVRVQNVPNHHIIEPDEDGDFQVWRIMFDSIPFLPLCSSSYYAAETIESWTGVYSLQYGQRLVVSKKDKLALQFCFNGGNMRRTYFREFVLPKEHKYLGTIIFHSATRIETINIDRKYFFQQFDNEHYGVSDNDTLSPYIVAFDKHDHPDAWDLDALQIALAIPKDVPVVPCNPKDSDSVRNVIITFLEYVRDLPQDE
jgi:hypothetical protein